MHTCSPAILRKMNVSSLIGHNAYRSVILSKKIVVARQQENDQQSQRLKHSNLVVVNVYFPMLKNILSSGSFSEKRFGFFDLKHK